MSVTPTITFDSGETQILPFTVERDNEVFDLTDSEIGWALRQDGQEYVSLSDEGVEIYSRDDSSGEFEVKLDADVTERLPSQTYEEVIKITDPGGDTSINIGRLRIREVK